MIGRFVGSFLLMMVGSAGVGLICEGVIQSTYFTRTFVLMLVYAAGWVWAVDR